MFLFDLFWIVDGIALLIAASHSLKGTWEVVIWVSGIAAVLTGLLGLWITFEDEPGGVADI